MLDTLRVVVCLKFFSSLHKNTSDSFCSNVYIIKATFYYIVAIYIKNTRI